MRFAAQLLLILRRSLRGLGRSPGYSAAVIVTVALGIGANVLVFSIANTALLRPLPYRQPDQLYAISTDHTGPDGTTVQYGLGDLELVRWRAATTTLAHLEALLTSPGALTGSGDPETINVGEASGGLFAVLGIAPESGRLFTDAEDVPHGSVVLISHEFWSSHLGRRASALGASLVVNGESRVIIGIMPPGVRPLAQAADLWIPLGVSETNMPHGPVARILSAVGRVKPGVTLAQLRAELTALGAALALEAPDSRKGFTGNAVTLRQSLVGQDVGTIVALVVLVAMLLLLACVNVINLMMARLSYRHGESALRLALGAGPWGVLEAPVVETLLLTGAGGTLGIAGAALVLGPLVAYEATQLPILAGTVLDAQVLVFAIVLIVVTGLACALIPGLRLLRATGTGRLLSGGRRTTGSRGDRQVRRGLMMVQIALALVLLAGAASVLRVLGRDAGINPGFNPMGIEAVELTLPASRYPTPETRTLAVDRLLQQVRATAGVQAASAVTNPFRLGASRETVLFIESRSVDPADNLLAHIRRIAPDYFTTMQIPILRGRAISEEDRADLRPVAVVSRAFAEQYWPNEEALGKRVRRTAPGAPWLTVVGIAGGVRDAGLSDPLGPMIYLPFAQANLATVTLIVRGSVPPAGLAGPLRTVVHQVDPLQAIDRMAPLSDYLAESLATQRFRALLLAVFAGLGLVLASVGVYGVTAYLLAERTREIAIRLAIGGGTGPVLRRLVIEAGRSVGLGIVGGSLVALALGTVARARVGNIVEVDVAATLAVAGLVALVAMVATVVPGWRAVRMPIADALRGEG